MGEVCNVFLHTHQLSAALYQHDKTSKELALFVCILLANFQPTYLRRSRKPQSQEKYSSSLKKCKEYCPFERVKEGVLIVQIIPLIYVWGLGSTGARSLFLHIFVWYAQYSLLCTAVAYFCIVARVLYRVAVVDKKLSSLSSPPL